MEALTDRPAPPRGQDPAPPALDVLIPHYEDGPGLRASLASVAAQTWTGALRVVVLDDGSSPAALAEAEAACEAFRAAGGRDLVLLRHDGNRGRPAARNGLLAAVAAPHVAWLDAGDVWRPKKLGLQFERLARLREGGADPSRLWITCPYEIAEGGRIRTHWQEVGGDQFRDLLRGEGLRAYLWTLLGTAESFRLAGRFDEGLPRLQDLDFFLAFLRAGGRLETVPGAEPLCRYEKSGLGRQAREVRACYGRILDRHAAALRDYPEAFAAELAARADWLAARFARANGQHGAAALYLARGALRAPRKALRAALGTALGRARRRLGPRAAR